MFRGVPILPLFYCARSMWHSIYNHYQYQYRYQHHYHYRIPSPISWPAALKAAGTEDDFCYIPMEEEEEKRPTSQHRKRFREMRIREYENRLRQYSRPEKVFRYFATIKMRNKAGRWEVYMTPADFVRSTTPGSRPQPEHLGLDKFHKVTEEQIREKRCKSLGEKSIFYSFHKDGLLTFGDYLFLIMLLSVPERYFELAFRLFDIQGTGNLSHDDLKLCLTKLYEGETHMGNMNVNHYFFGPDLNQKLNVNVFLEFQRRLTTEVLLLEFNALLKNSRTVLSEVAFAKMVLAYSSKNSVERSAILQRVQRKYKNTDQGVTQDDFLTFFRFIADMAAVDAALTFHYLSGADVSRQTLKHIANVVVGVHLSDHIIDVIFTIFDQNDDGVLSRKDFFATLQDRSARRAKRKAPHLAAYMGIACKCAAQVLGDRFMP